MPKQESDIPSVAGVVGMLWVAGRRAAAPGRGARRVHTSHTSETTRRAGHYEGPSQDPHTPPLPQATWGQHQAQRQQLCWQQNREGTQRTERKGKTANLFLGSTPHTAKHVSERQAANSATQALLTCASQGTNELEGRCRGVRRGHDPPAPRTHRGKPSKHVHTTIRTGQGYARYRGGLEAHPGQD
jgi:hypothetical protein